MIVFWRLFLALCLTDFVFFHRTISNLQKENRFAAMAVRTGTFIVLSFSFCASYLTMKWPFLGLVELHGWMCLVLFALFHGFSDYYFNFGGKIKHGYLLSFLTKNGVNLLFLFLIAPLHILYETGHFFAEPWIIFLVGLLTTTRVLGWFIFSIEQDAYGKDYPTFDERWMLMMVRAIFFLIMLLPGVRWLVLFMVWLGTCLYARKIRLMDVSRWAFYAGVVGAALVGFLVRLRFYLIG